MGEVSAPEPILVISALVAFILNIAALFGLGMRIGKFEGRVDTKLEAIERAQAVTASLESTATLRESIVRLDRRLDLLDAEKTSEHKVNNLIQIQIKSLEEAVTKRHTRRGDSR